MEQVELLNLIIPILAIFIGTFILALTGFAAGLIGTPILLIVYDLKQAAALLSIFLLTFSAIEIRKCWQDIDFGTVKQLAIGSVVGIILGVYLLKYGDPILLKKSFGIYLVGYVLYSLKSKKKLKIMHKLGHLFGFLGGLASGLYNGGGAFTASYVNNKLDNTRNIRATLIGALAIVNFLRVPLVIQNKILTLDIFKQALITFPFFFLALFLGRKFFHKIEDKKDTFQKIILVLLFLSGLSLIIR